MDEAAALRRRASVRDDEMDDGPPALSCAWPEKSQRGVEPDGSGIQHQANRQNPRLQPADRGPEGRPRMIRTGRAIPGTHIRPVGQPEGPCAETSTKSRSRVLSRPGMRASRMPGALD